MFGFQSLTLINLAKLKMGKYKPFISVLWKDSGSEMWALYIKLKILQWIYHIRMSVVYNLKGYDTMTWPTALTAHNV